MATKVDHKFSGPSLYTDSSSPNEMNLDETLEIMLTLIEKREEDGNINEKLSMWSKKLKSLLGEALSEKERDVLRGLVTFNLIATFLDEGTKKEIKLLKLKTGGFLSKLI